MILAKFYCLQNHGYLKMSVSPDTLSLEFISSGRNDTLGTLDSLQMQRADASSTDYYYDDYILDMLQDIPSDFTHEEI